jgi:hypothetical protein
VAQEETSIVWLQHGKQVMALLSRHCLIMAGKHVSAVMNTHATQEEPLQEVFSVQSTPKLYHITRGN